MRDISSYGLKDILTYSREGFLRWLRLTRLRMIGIHVHRLGHCNVKDGGKMYRCGDGQFAASCPRLKPQSCFKKSAETIAFTIR